jgi:hydroxyacylglutathione hydrolase
LGSTLFSTWVGFLVPFGKPVALVVGSADSAKKARLELARIGFDNVPGFLDSEALTGTQQLSQLSVCDLKSALRDGDAPAVLDVRTSGEWDAEHIDGALHVPLPSLPQRVSELPKGRRLAIICGSGYRSSIAASLLQSCGFRHVQNVMGGMGAYVETTATEWQTADLVFTGENI